MKSRKNKRGGLGQKEKVGNKEKGKEKSFLEVGVDA